MKKLAPYFSILATLAPLTTFAATQMTLKDLMAEAAVYMDRALALLMGFAILAFVWYVVRYFIVETDTKRGEAAKYVGWSVLGFFIILSVWGLVNVLIATFNLGTGSPGSWTNLQNLFPQ